ncbi:GGDEF domain-containing protein [Acinetobacter sp. NCu2D-2]|uniref:GGDEF domain-containing protein n=1 Tax=Acinetobacter sp. NCu2D-2 TaxID=1608473 RepID=UPI001D0CF552|nr:GGDEF domain-containing protein [Acinetobacter sp. NCu2D-2]
MDALKLTFARDLLITSLLISTVLFVGVYFNSHGDAYQMLLFSLIYLPILVFSVYISWNSTLKSRVVFLHHTLNDYNRRAFEKLAHTDALTGLNNRRYFEYLAKQHLEQQLENPTPTTLLVFDVDHFKKINDTYGHDVGDQVIQMIANIASQEMRHTDVLARYGGEEFIALLPHTHLDDALRIGERLRQKIENTVVELDHRVQLRFTISIGATILESCDIDLNHFVKQADLALYQAKANGRNRVEQYDHSMDSLALKHMKHTWQMEERKLVQE